MRDHDHRLPHVVEALKDREDLRARARIEVSGGLVREDERRVVQEGPRDRHALLLPSGELARAVVDAIAETDLLERAERALSSRVAISSVDERQLDVLDRVETREQIEGLEDEAEMLVAKTGELVVGELADVLAGQEIRATVRDVEAAKDVHQGRLAGAGGTHHREELARPDVEIDPAKGVHDDLSPDAIGLRDPAELDDALGHHRPTITGPPPPPNPPPGRGVEVVRDCGNTTRSPSARPAVTSVTVSFAMPKVTSVSTASPSFRTWT